MWISEWAALSKRVSGLLSAAEFYKRFQAPGTPDAYGVAKRELLPNSQEIFDILLAYRERHQATLPAQAAASLDHFIERSRGHFSVNGDTHNNPELATQLRITALVSFQAEFSYHLSDFDATARRLSERAFSHLQRSIVADADVANKWQTAFDTGGEVACEALGAVHLLLHGIWAFKANSAGERTDLIMQDHTINLAEAERTAEAMVLTEWKLVPKAELLEERSEQAYSQAARYSAGSLGSFELATYRYLVLVSKDTLEVPADRHEGGVQYRHVNIAVKPRSPSKSR